MFSTLLFYFILCRTKRYSGEEAANMIVHFLNICIFKFAFQNGVNELFWSSGSGDIAK